MAEQIQIPEDLKQRFTRLQIVEDDLREALFLWNGLDQAVKTAAGNDEETSEQIKKTVDETNPGISGLITALARAFKINSEKGKDTHNNFADTNAENLEMVNKLGSGEGGSTGVGKH